MPHTQLPHSPDLWTILVVLIVSLLSGIVSITRRAAQGTPVKAMWLISEFTAAILCGWMAYDVYPRVAHLLPEWVTMIVFVAAAAHSGGRLLQGAGNILESRLPDSLKGRIK